MFHEGIRFSCFSYHITVRVEMENAMNRSYLDMMEESLKRKIEILHEIEKENEKQKEILKDPAKVNIPDFDAAVECKGKMIDQLTELNDGFESLYEKVRDELQINKDQYRLQIERMQDMIRQITELSSRLQTQELRNKQMADSFFSAERTSMKQGKKSVAAAYNYYKNMNHSQVTPPQFFDSKN